jgi:adenine-specific DNA glycosylase
VGPYASGAIASIGLGLREPAIDSNARRVLSRWLVADPADFSALKPAYLEMVGHDLVDHRRPGDWNEALMELGALVCVARSPRCEECPMGDVCRAGKAGTAEKIPPPKIRVKTTPVDLSLLAILWKDQILLLPPQFPPVAHFAGDDKPVRDDLTGLHKGLWGLPAGPWLPPSGPGTSRLEEQIWGPFVARLTSGQDVAIKEEPALVGSFSHAVTKYRLRVHLYGLRLGEEFRFKVDSMGRLLLLEPKRGERFGPELSGPTPGEVARFCQRPDVGLPVSNLVTKSLALISKSRV